MAKMPLDDVTILDVGQGIAPGYCTKLLASLGAHVLKIEPPTGDILRSAGPFPNDIPHPEHSGLFLYLNQGKQSATLDISKPMGRELLMKMLQDTDVLIENFSPGLLTSLSLGHETLREKAPQLVHCSLSWFGATGPYRDFQGCELVAYALSGHLYLTGDPDKPPLKAGGYQSEYQAGISAALAVMSALAYRDITGEGQYLDVSVIEAAAHTFDGTALFSLAKLPGPPLRRRGTRQLNTDQFEPYPSTILPCKDGWVHVHWSSSNPEGLAFLTGNPRLADSDLQATPMGHADEIDETLSAWLAERTADEIMTLAQEVRMPFTKVQHIPEVLDDPQNQATGFFQSVNHPEAGSYRYPSSPIHLDMHTNQPSRAPLLGEQNQKVYCDQLGLSRHELDQLQLNGIV